MAAAVAFVPPVLGALAYALYERAFSHEARIRHSIAAGVLWQRTWAALAGRPSDGLRRVQLVGMRDDDTFFHHDCTQAFQRYWSEQHDNGAFRDDTETLMRAMGMPCSAVQAHLRFRFREPDDTRAYEATYQWQQGQAPRLMAFPVYPQTKLDQTGGILFTQKLVYAALEPDKDVTELVRALAGPRGNFYQDVPASHRPTVNVSFALLEYRRQGYRFLKLVDTLGLTYRYDLEREFEICWPRDAPEHLILHDSSCSSSMLHESSCSSPITYQTATPASSPTTSGSTTSPDRKKRNN